MSSSSRYVVAVQCIGFGFIAHDSKFNFCHNIGCHLSCHCKIYIASKLVQLSSLGVWPISRFVC